MDKQEIYEMFDAFLDYLIKKNYIAFRSTAVYAEAGNIIKRHFTTTPNEDVAEALDAIRGDEYYDLIEMYYRDGKTIEAIAEALNVDTKTVTRNKKRLCLKIYLLLKKENL